MTVYDLLNKYQMTVTTAESCTGGLVASGLVDIAGISAFFKEGYVTYAPEAKERILGVPKEVIEQYGVVSEETAAKMAEGAGKNCRCRYCNCYDRSCGAGRRNKTDTGWNRLLWLFC